MPLSAYQLEVSDEMLEAIVDVRNRLARGELAHVVVDSEKDLAIKLPDNGFSMSHWGPDLIDPECGTVHCIGGWAERLHDVTDDASERPDGLDNLFYPEVLGDWDQITTDDAVKAIDNWRETGDPRWLDIRPDLGKRKLAA